MQLSKSNKATIKVSILLILAIVLLWLFCYKYVENIPFQVGYLVVANIVYSIIFKPIDNLKLWKKWYKTLLIYLAFNLLFAFLELHFHIYEFLYSKIYKTIDFYQKMSPLEFDKHYIMKTFFTLMNTILTLDCILRLITFSDLILLPFRSDTKINILLFRSIFNFLSEKFKLNEIVTDTIPEYQFYIKKNIFTDFKFLYKRNLIYIFTMLKLVEEQSPILGQLINNKINHSNIKTNGNKN